MTQDSNSSKSKENLKNSILPSWLVRLSDGNVLGPLSSNDVRQRIESHQLQGSDQIALVSSDVGDNEQIQIGDEAEWRELSSHPEFDAIFAGSAAFGADSPLSVFTVSGVKPAPLPPPPPSQELEQSHHAEGPSSPLSLLEEVAEEIPQNPEQDVDPLAALLNPEPDSFDFSDQTVPLDRSSVTSLEATRTEATTPIDIIPEDEPQYDLPQQEVIETPQEDPDKTKVWLDNNSENSNLMNGLADIGENVGEYSSKPVRQSKAGGGKYGTVVRVQDHEQDEQDRLDEDAKVDTKKANNDVVELESPLVADTSRRVSTKSSSSSSSSSEEYSSSWELPILLISAAFLLGLIAVGLIWIPEENSSDELPDRQAKRVHLQLPKKGGETLTPQQSEKLLAQAYQYLQGDTFAGYLEAENTLLKAVEVSNPELRAQVFSTLCIVQRELWPYAHADLQDLQTFKWIVQEAKRMDPGGYNGGVCETLYLMVSNQWAEAKSLAENWLSIRPQEFVLYDVTAELLQGEQRMFEAVNYAEKARVVKPTWLKPYVVEARARARERQTLEAVRLYQSVLKANPRHSVAQVELGLLELEIYDHQDRAYDLLKTIDDRKEFLPSDVELELQLGLAKLYEKRGQKQQALQAAQRASLIDASLPELKALVERLGGTEWLKKNAANLLSSGGYASQSLSQSLSREAVYRGDRFARLGDCVSAQAEYKVAFEQDRKNSLAALKAGQCLWQLNQSQEAIEWVKKSIAADSKATTPYIVLADYYSQRFDYLSAVRALQKVEEIRPRQVEVLKGFALIEVRRRNFKGAIEFADRALKLYDADPETLVIMAKAQRGVRNYIGASRFLQRAIELDETKVEVQGLYAQNLVDLRGLDSALIYINSLIGRFSQIVDYQLTKAEMMIQGNRPTDAIKVAQEIRSLDRNNKKALLLLGQAHQLLGKKRDALEAFLLAAELDPSDVAPLYSTGLIYSQDPRTYKDAIRQYKRVLQVNPRFPGLHTELGRLYLKMSDPDKALAEAEEERILNPDLPDSYILAAETHYEMKRYTKCAGEYQKAVAHHGQDTLLYVRMARCYRLSGATDAAVSLLTQARARESGQAEIYKELGATYQVRGQINEAAEAYRRYLDLAPQASDREEISAILEELSSGG